MNTNKEQQSCVKEQPCKQTTKQSNPKKVYIKDYVLANGSIYTGELLDGKLDGWGILKYPNNERYQGNFVKGKKHGVGKYYYQSGEYYIGGWSNNQKSGQGIYFYDNNKRYEGQFANNMKHGEGAIYETNGNCYRGNFADNHKHGCGQYYDAADNRTIKFIFDKGKEISCTEVPQTTKNGKVQNQLAVVPNYQKFAEISPEGIASVILENYQNLHTLQYAKQRPEAINSQANGFISLDFSGDTPEETTEKTIGNTPINEGIQLKNATLRQIRIDQWNTDNVCQWLEEIQFGDVVAEFRFQNVTGFSLLRLKDQDLKQLGVPYEEDRVVLMREINFLRLYFKTQCTHDSICKFKNQELDYELLIKLQKAEGRLLKKQESEIIYEEEFRKYREQELHNMTALVKKQAKPVSNKNNSNGQKESENSDVNGDTQSSSSSQSSNQAKERKNNQESQNQKGKNSKEPKRPHIQSTRIPNTEKIELEMRKKRIDTKILIQSSQIEMGRSIGKGNYGEVFLSTWLGQQVAVKRYMKKNGFRNRHVARLLEETQITKKLLHPNIVLYMGMFMIDNDYAVVMEYLAGGSLFDYLHIKGYKLSEAKISKVCRNIAVAMVYLHGKNIIHCDLKSSNLLVDQNYKVKISDFGLSQIKMSGANKPKRQGSTRLGAPQWMAPEVMRGERYEFACDVFSFGMVLWELLTCQIPYRQLTQKEVLEQVSKSEERLIRVPEHNNENLVKLFQMCTEREPKKRPTFNQIVKYLEKNQK